MANHVSTWIEVSSDNDAVFTRLKEMMGDPTYKELMDTMWLYNILYGEGEYDREIYTDRMSAKWCYVDELELDETSFEMRTTSAWYFPEQAIRQIQYLLKDVDEDVCVSFTYEDESLDPIGGGACYKGELIVYEESVEYPDEDSFDTEEEYDQAVEKMWDGVYETCTSLKNEAMVDVYEEMRDEEEVYEEE